MMNENHKEYIKLLINSMYDVQKVRLAIEGRIRAFSQSGEPRYIAMAKELSADLAELANAFEDSVEKRVAQAVKAAPIMAWLKKVKGIGPRYAGTLIGTIGVPPETVSQLWSLCGMGVIPVCDTCGKISYWGDEKAYFLNRQVERRWEQHIKKEESAIQDEQDFKRKNYIETEKKLCLCDEPETRMVAPQRRYYKGLLLTHNPFLKMTCWKIAGQFVRQGDFYRTEYEQRKEFYVNRDGDTLTLGHIENRARRATVKLFLSHLWEMWRKAEGMEAGQIYLQKKLGAEFDKHHSYIHPPYADIYDSIAKAAD